MPNHQAWHEAGGPGGHGARSASACCSWRRAAPGAEGGNDDAAPSTATGAGGQRSVEYLAPSRKRADAGGTLAYALEADADGFDPTTCALVRAA
ncbi:MAG: hypothetical protein R2699_06330 [Acidimicrobiales bacterium]